MPPAIRSSVSFTAYQFCILMPFIRILILGMFVCLNSTVWLFRHCSTSFTIFACSVFEYKNTYRRSPPLESDHFNHSEASTAQAIHLPSRTSRSKIDLLVSSWVPLQKHSHSTSSLLVEELPEMRLLVVWQRTQKCESWSSKLVLGE